MRRLLIYMFVFVTVCLLAGCEDKRVTATLSDISSLIDNGRSDSALIMLDSLQEKEKPLSRHAQMLCRLYRQNAYNKLDTIFRSTDEAQAIADYFEDNGTPNEQMLAYYLLGRAYYDLHEAPMALHYFQKACECADTTDTDCNYRQLSRVYGQMSDIFYQQNLMERSLSCDNMSIKYGWYDKDTISALLSMGHKVFVYKSLHKTDSAIALCEIVINKLRMSGHKKLSAGFHAGLIKELLEQGNIDKAKDAIDINESESGFFDSNNNIIHGREVYYYAKGNYFLAINKLDSAEYYFRKELREGNDFNNQNAGSKGLAMLFQKKHIPDSVAKYALYSYAMNDSAYAQMAIDEVERMQAMYDYTRNRDIAEQERNKREKIEKENGTIWNICIGLLLLVILSIYIIRREKKKRHHEHVNYEKSVANIAKVQTELNRLRSHREEIADVASDLEQMRVHEHELNILIEEKEKEVEQLLQKIDSYKSRFKEQSVSVEDVLKNSSVYESIKKKADCGQILAEDEWQELNKLVIETLPNFYNFISSKQHNLNNNEFKICILRRLDFTPKTIAYMLNLSPSSITKIRNNMSKKLFGEEDNSKEFDKMLKQLS